MVFRKMIAASCVTVAALGGIAAVAISRATPGQLLPTHWNAAGQPDRFTSAPAAVLMPVLISAVVVAVFAVIPSIEPLQRKLDQSAPLYRTAWAGLLGMMLLVELSIAGPLLGFAVPRTLHLAAAGILLFIIGNMLPKSRPGYFVGIRTPWTLTDPNNWVATHRFGSRTMMAGGAMIVVAALLPLTPGVRGMTMFAAILIAVLPPIVFSFLYWRRVQT